MSVYALTYTYGGPSEILAEHRPAPPSLPA